jgi:hypothetical protein
MIDWPGGLSAVDNENDVMIKAPRLRFVVVAMTLSPKDQNCRV